MPPVFADLGGALFMSMAQRGGWDPGEASLDAIALLSDSRVFWIRVRKAFGNTKEVLATAEELPLVGFSLD
jgi:hypothetical protein